MRKLIALEPDVYQQLQQNQASSTNDFKHKPIQNKILSKLDAEMNQILNSDKSDSEKVVLYNEVLQKSNFIRRKTTPNRRKEPKIAESTILSKFRKKAPAKKILSQLKHQKNLSWDDDGSLILDDIKIPGSNIHKLFQSSLKKRDPTLPGLNEFNSFVWEKL